jgi:hypothetical protein
MNKNQGLSLPYPSLPSRFSPCPLELPRRTPGSICADLGILVRKEPGYPLVLVGMRVAVLGLILEVPS